MESKTQQIIQEEYEALLSIYEDELDASCHEDEILKSNEFVINLLPNIGSDNERKTVSIKMKLIFPDGYPQLPLKISTSHPRGIDDHESDEISKLFREKSAEFASERKEDEREDGFMFEFVDFAKEILTEYNDTLKGRCPICLEDFKGESGDVEDSFTDSGGLIAITDCLHRFHLICLYHDWFIPRSSEIGKFGDKIRPKMKEI